MGILVAVIKNERVIELINLRDKDIVRDCDKMCDVSDPQFKDLKVGDEFLNRDRNGNPTTKKEKI